MYKDIAVIGAGLVGPLHANVLKKKGYRVTVYEAREDPRIPSNKSGGRSFDLALSRRGLNALDAVGLKELIADESHSVKVYSRLVHNLDGSTSVWKYGEKDECLHSIERKRLNEVMLTKTEENEIPIKFGHKLIECDVDTGEMQFRVKDRNDTVKVQADFIFGCDGAHSVVRQRGIMQNRKAKPHFSQHYIPHGYREIHVSPTASGDFALDKNHLHLWPRNEFMLMGLPNPDKSITMTLFMPLTSFESLKTEEDVVQFFMTYFADTINAIGGQKKLVQEYFSVETGSMISIKCDTHHFEKALLLGDAAHAMVPFYGQGVNAGFEDCILFEKFLDSNNNDFVKAAAAYAESHIKDTHAIVELSLYNYDEMRKLMNDRLFWFVRNMQSFVYKNLPALFIPLYTMVAFSQMPYADVKAKHIQQSNIVRQLSFCTILWLILAGLLLTIPYTTTYQTVLVLLSIIAVLFLFLYRSELLPSFKWKYEHLD